ncbi:hypothetical protein [Herbiconiux flava]|uniref:Uncharacterized protein n=1 Tax=Herbiconiux flava TaxID=881268 RepID=A0A852SUJ2_9MICO|nr:hypothetical protein [Herbiconiux flava]NYD72304.1 hypothetical protein [Herbiconiux flava]GLK17733.1 hypothetical protein GCM10017602_22150 [Herbiconiux flava]
MSDRTTNTYAEEEFIFEKADAFINEHMSTLAAIRQAPADAQPAMLEHFINGCLVGLDRSVLEIVAFMAMSQALTLHYELEGRS